MKTAQAFTQVMEGSVRKNRWLLAAVLAALLVGATWYCVSVWRAAPSMLLYGNIIMGVAAILVLVAGCGLITLVFYSYREGCGESARRNRAPRE
jgi:heme/copper-type cytochrome/quinol oxidase subunit 2